MQRAVAVLDVIANEGRVTAADISRDLALARSSTSDLVSTMLEARLIDRHDGGFTMGHAWIGYAAGLIGGRNVLERFTNEWDSAEALHGHTVSIQALMGTQMMCVEVRMGREVLPATPRVGSRYPVWANGHAEPILWHLPSKAVERSLQAFGAFAGISPAEADEMLRWVHAHSQPTPPPAAARFSSDGNLDICVYVPAAHPERIPLALMLHLAPQHSADITVLSEALTAFADSLSDDRRTH